MMMRSALYQTNAQLDFYSASSLKQKSVYRHVAPTRRYYPDSEPTSICSFSLMMCDQRGSNKYQCIVFGLIRQWIDPTIYYTRGESAKPLHHQCGEFTFEHLFCMTVKYNHNETGKKSIPEDHYSSCRENNHVVFRRSQDITTVHGHIYKYSPPSIFYHIFHIKPHFFKNIF